VSWHELFAMPGSLLEPIVRGTIMYLALFALFRLVIRRRVGAVGMSDILLVVIIADASQSGLSGDGKSITEALIVVGTIFFWNWVIDWLNYHVPALHKVLEPPPLPLIQNGRVLRANLRHEYVTLDELESKLREHGITRFSEVDKAFMEPEGEISVIRKPSPSSTAPAA
jgi:uncharacterized membrane protein YcaP (DUF421 family)